MLFNLRVKLSKLPRNPSLQAGGRRATSYFRSQSIPSRELLASPPDGPSRVLDVVTLVDGCSKR